MADNQTKIPFRQLLLQYSNTAVNILFPLILFPYMTRTLGPEGYGVIGYYESLMQVVIVLSAFGVQYYGLRQLSKSAVGDAGQANIVLHLLLINVMMAVFGMIMYLVYVYSKPIQIAGASITLLYAYIMVIHRLHMDWYFQSQEKFRFLLERALISRLLVLAAALIFVRKPEHLIIYIVISAFNYTFISGVAVYQIRSLFSRWKWDKELFLSLIRSLWPFALLGILNTTYFTFDTLILARTGRVEELGYYTVGAKIVRIGLNFFTAASVVIFVKLFRNNVNRSLQTDSLLMTVQLSFPISAMLLVFAKPVIFFVSGEQYLPSVPILQVFALLWLIVPLHDFFSLQVFLVHHKEAALVKLFIAANLVSFVLNLVLIPIWFTDGAAWAIVTTEVLVLVSAMILSRRYFRIKRDQWMEILATLTVFPIAWLSYRLTERWMLPSFVQLVAGTLITLVIHIPLQLLVFKSRFWLSLWAVVKPRLRMPW